MSTVPRLLNRATIAAAVLVGGVAASSAANASAEQDDEPRSVLTIGVDACPGSADGAAISVGYDDLVDGHTPQQVTERLADQSGELWSSTELRQVAGDYFNVHNFPATADIPITDSSVFTYSLTISYEDGVTQTQSVNLVIADRCDIASPTTAAPTTTPAAPRFELSKAGASCLPASGTEAFVEFSHADTVDGHVPVEYRFRLVAGGAVVHDQPGPHGLAGEDGEHAGWFVPGDFGVDRVAATTYTLTLWVKYDDGVVASDSVSSHVAARCEDVLPTTTTPSSSPATTQPSGTLPQTGSSMTWGIATFGGVLSAAGGALVLAGRRRRTA